MSVPISIEIHRGGCDVISSSNRILESVLNSISWLFFLSFNKLDDIIWRSSQFWFLVFPKCLNIHILFDLFFHLIANIITKRATRNFQENVSRPKGGTSVLWKVFYHSIKNKELWGLKSLRNSVDKHCKIGTWIYWRIAPDI